MTAMANHTLPDHGAGLNPGIMALAPVGGRRRPVVSLTVPAAIATCGRATLTATIEVATPMPEYDGNPAHAFLGMLDPANGLAPGDPARMAARIIESVDVEPAPLRLVLGSQALASTIATLRTRIAGFEAQTALAASTDVPQGG